MQYAKGELKFECEFDGQCSAAFASRDDRDRHEREDHQWDAEDHEYETED